MKIVFIGDADPNRLTLQRANALSRLGHHVTMADLYAPFRHTIQHPLLGRLHYRCGYRLLQNGVCDWVNELVHQHAANPPDLVWVDHGELLGHKATSMLRLFGVPLVLHNQDDPTGTRDGHRFDSLLEALPLYDLCVVVRQKNMSEYLQMGAKAVHRSWMSYDEVMHRPFDDVAQIQDRFRSDVAFVGTWIRGEGRDSFLFGLAERGLNVAIWGNRWERAPLWKQLKQYWRGPALHGRDYVAAIQGSKVALGLLSHLNRDLHTVRSVEIPYAGGLLCAERTSEHLEMYRDGLEAVLWDNVDECAALCHRLLADESLGNRIRASGAIRVRQNGHGNEVVCSKVIDRVASNSHAQRIGQSVGT